MFWTSRFKLAFGLFSSSSAFGLMHILAEAKIGLKTTKQNNEKMIRSSLTNTIELSGAQTKPRTCSRTCGLYSQDQKTHCTGNEGGPCPYCWWNTLTPPAWGEGEEEGESRKRKKEGRSSLVRVQENFPKHSKMSIIFMDQTNWRFTTWSHNCLAFGIILFVWCSVIPPPSVESHWYFLLESFSDLGMAVQFPCVKSAHHFIQKRSFGTKK